MFQFLASDWKLRPVEPYKKEPQHGIEAYHHSQRQQLGKPAIVPLSWFQFLPITVARSLIETIWRICGVDMGGPSFAFSPWSPVSASV